MGISLEEEKVVLPSVKLSEIGSYIVGHLVHMEQRDERDPETRQVKLKSDGKPKQVCILTILVKEFSPGALVGSGGEWRAPEPGDEARIFIQGSTWQWWIEAKKNCRVEVGDVLRWKFENVTPKTNPMHSDTKNRKFALRKPKDDERSNVEICEQLYKQLTQPENNFADSKHEDGGDIDF